MKYIILPIFRLILTILISIYLLVRTCLQILLIISVFLYHLDIGKTKEFIYHEIYTFWLDNNRYFNTSSLSIPVGDKYYYYKNPIHFFLRKKTEYKIFSVSNGKYYVAIDSLDKFE